MSAQTPSPMLIGPLIATDLANVATPVRKELIEIARLDLHRAANNHKPRSIGSRVQPWYIPPLAVLQALRIRRGDPRVCRAHP
jgi:hypothetical protein